ncbi:hypothetical protein F0562_032328 [Nyssa sinensis]|uniref:Uncharacterized protein n=1 Tax=Nyssa sinensis TaxID=561372 RepID=A0A5J5AMG3_9ASTE|nr:hypothetical protein F0562_032328 [Nyssa sinensis]
MLELLRDLLHYYTLLHRPLLAASTIFPDSFEYMKNPKTVQLVRSTDWGKESFPITVGDTEEVPQLLSIFGYGLMAQRRSSYLHYLLTLPDMGSTKFCGRRLVAELDVETEVSAAELVSRVEMEQVGFADPVVSVFGDDVV